MNQHYYGIIMAGGIGSRFWPESTAEHPKQFLDLLGTGKSFLQQTFERLKKIIPSDQIYILTNDRYKRLVLSQLPEISSDQVIAEPVMRNTAPAILYAAKKIHTKDKEAVMLVAPSDHYIAKEGKFEENINEAFTAAKSNDKLITLGIVPHQPHTGYGYIQYDKSDTNNFKKVIKFTEKPNKQTAVKFLSEGNYLWNAGIFVWSTQSVLESFQKYLPEMYTKLSANDEVYNTPLEKDFIEKNFPALQNISIDYGILEKADNVFVLPADFIWNDLGAWNAIYGQLKQNDGENVVINSEVLADESFGNLIKTNDKKVIIKDLNDYMIVDTNKVLMIIPRKDDQKVKEYIEKFKK